MIKKLIVFLKHGIMLRKMKENIKPEYHSTDAFLRGFISVFNVLPNYEKLYSRRCNRLNYLNEVDNESYFDDQNNLRLDSLRVYIDLVSAIKERLQSKLTLSGDHEKIKIAVLTNSIDHEKYQIMEIMNFIYENPKTEIAKLENPFYPIIKT